MLTCLILPKCTEFIYIDFRNKNLFQTGSCIQVIGAFQVAIHVWENLTGK